MAAPKISPCSFDDGAVGLSIVAAMLESGPKRSDPIPIKGRVGPTLEFQEKEEEEEEDVELSESYTCVIAHVGEGRVRKREYFGGGGDEAGGGGSGIGCKFGVSSGVFLESPEVGPTCGVFLSCCFLCRKKLFGIDIFMYSRGEAFCSVDCRSQQILNDDYKKKCRSGAAKARESFVYCASLIFDAGVAAA